jgi:RND family efflux transporter MFP subunit
MHLQLPDKFDDGVDAANSQGAAASAHPSVAGERPNSATHYSAGTGRQLQRFAAAAALVLLVAFLCVHFLKVHAEHDLVGTTNAFATALPLVDVVSVHSATSGGPLILPGETAAWYESVIYARVSGYVGAWSADIGDHVEKGQILASIETPELDADFLAAKAKLSAAEAQVKVRQADAAFAASTYARWRDSPKGVVSEQEREDKKAGQATSTAQLDAARAQVNLAQADVARLGAFEQFKHVTAPYAGTVSERRIDIGNLVTAGSSSNSTPLYRMVQDDPLRVFVDVPQSAAADLMKVGVPADIVTDDHAARHFAGKITRTSAAVDPQARTFRAEIDIPNASHGLVPGMYVQVGFQLDNRGLMQVPAAALVFHSGHPQVAVVTRDGTVHLRNVAIARDDGNFIELQSGALSGERLALNLSSGVNDGDKVRVSEVRSASVAAPPQAP